MNPLMTLLNQAERERDQLVVACQSAALARKTSAEQAEQLLAYRGDYEQRWSTQFRTEGRMELVNCYRGFMDRLSDAVEQQQCSTELAAGRYDAALLRLREAELRVAAVRKLIERRSDEARLAGERIEQKASDEFAARTGWSRRRDFQQTV